MTETFFQELKEELQKGTSKKGHPFRYCTLATVGQQQFARLRTIVLRRTEEDLKLVFYTDKRTKKIVHIKENNRVSLLFYHPKKLLQVKIEGKAQIVTDKTELQKYWSGVQPKSRKDYITKLSPGSPLSNPDNVEYFEDKNYFCIVKVHPSKIEYLKLKRPNHLRVLFTRDGEEKEDENDKWDGQFLVP